ncbi:gliding motility lipoprotein GldB [Sphingobacterium hungaricum]|uniref:Gliding motility lipoprotein GldB n=1 Tax=Sphingobacterium hungaricum TaxID=2082723 RepID=A0A928YRX1_9SPHI|nr:gliding motility lipoprotein GldB [Sphingobacterium hungaricum]MBE8713713.1 gliding motility lipoprotein GldB [Sphingobacterium hungaricum]
MRYPLLCKVFLFVPILLALSCQNTKKLPDVSALKKNIKIERFDQEFSSIDSASILDMNRKFQKEYGNFYTDYMIYMLEAGDPKDTVKIKSIMETILGTRDSHELIKSVNEKFPNLKSQEEGLSDAFAYLTYYFPDYELPRFISFYSGFGVQVPTGEGYVGIGLDMFLGSDSRFYPALVNSIPLYISRRFTPENIVPRVVETVLREDLFPQENLDVSTLEHMVYQGKILYSMDCVLPNVADTLKIGYTTDQLNWAKSYQKDVWAWFLQENLLYSTDQLQIQKYFTEAPFTAELGENNSSAPKLGMYMGWQMVRKYMEKNPEMDLKELYKIPAQQILEDSKFKGK